jgi:hypothetical protein
MVMAYNPKVAGSKPAGGMYFFLSSKPPIIRQKYTFKYFYTITSKKFDYLFFFYKEADNQLIRLNRHGAEDARGAHNSEDVGSKPTAGISLYSG